MRDANQYTLPYRLVRSSLGQVYDQAYSEIKGYQQIIGSLLYAQIGSRPDISFAVHNSAKKSLHSHKAFNHFPHHTVSYSLGVCKI